MADLLSNLESVRAEVDKAVKVLKRIRLAFPRPQALTETADHLDRFAQEHDEPNKRAGEVLRRLAKAIEGKELP